MNEMSAGWHSEPNATFSDKSTPYRLCLRGVGKRFQLSMRRVFSTLFVVLLLVAAFLLYLQRGALSSTAESFIPADFNAITSALKTYKINAGRYPTDEQGLRALLDRPVSEPVPKRWVQILRKLPTDSWDNEYHYRALPNDDKRGFELRSAGKDRILGTKDDLSSLDR
jgi:general secretion pathway protein G